MQEEQFDLEIDVDLVKQHLETLPPKVKSMFLALMEIKSRSKSLDIIKRFFDDYDDNSPVHHLIGVVVGQSINCILGNLRVDAESHKISCPNVPYSKVQASTVVVRTLRQIAQAMEESILELQAMAPSEIIN